MPSVAPIPDSYWVLDNQLLAGEYPGAEDESAARAKLERFLDAGIRSFIDLTQQRDELAPYEGLLAELARERRIECRYVRVAIRDLGIPTNEEMVRILATIRADIGAGRAVYVHCWGGIGRTGTVAGCWLVEQGLSPDVAIEHIRQLRRGTPDGYRPSPETEEQRDFIRAWAQEPC